MVIPIEYPIWKYSDKDYLNYAIENIQKMFPDFEKSWILESKLCKAEFAQPITEMNYSKFIPSKTTPFENVFISTMAQIYPEDRGTNYGIRDGKDIANVIYQKLNEI